MTSRCAHMQLQGISPPVLLRKLKNAGLRSSRWSAAFFPGGGPRGGVACDLPGKKLGGFVLGIGLRLALLGEAVDLWLESAVEQIFRCSPVAALVCSAASGCEHRVTSRERLRGPAFEGAPPPPRHLALELSQACSSSTSRTECSAPSGSC